MLSSDAKVPSVLGLDELLLTALLEALGSVASTNRYAACSTSCVGSRILTRHLPDRVNLSSPVAC